MAALEMSVPKCKLDALVERILLNNFRQSFSGAIGRINYFNAASDGVALQLISNRVIDPSGDQHNDSGILRNHFIAITSLTS